MASNVPNEPPPSYEASSSISHHQTRNGIPPQRRRSMEDEHRPLPQGWIRQYDPESEHQFFVDTTVDPPRSIWHHPYDDEQYLNSLSPDKREEAMRLHRSVSLKDIEAESSDDEDHIRHHGAKGRAQQPVAAQAPGVGAGANSSASGEELHGLHKFGRKMKDKITHSTHQDRERQRMNRARQEEEAYKAHMAFRRAMSEAVRTGQPQLLGKDKNGRDVYIEPPQGPAVPQGAYGYNPYAQGPYANPNARFVRPSYPYARPYGYGYGGGYGFPLMGGLLGGALLGSALF